jgi:hypothetical protein
MLMQADVLEQHLTADAAASAALIERYDLNYAAMQSMYERQISVLQERLDRATSELCSAHAQVRVGAICAINY